MTAFRSIRTIIIVKDRAFFGRPQLDMGNIDLGDEDDGFWRPVTAGPKNYAERRPLKKRVTSTGVR